jgi:hypothetical protein
MTKTLSFALPLSLMLAGITSSDANAAQIYYLYPVGIMLNQYQEPDGSYANLSDFTRSINGTPCGIECTRRSEAHWGWTSYHW